MLASARSRVAISRIMAAAAVCCTAGCLPTRDLDEYHAEGVPLARDGAGVAAGGRAPASELAPGAAGGSGETLPDPTLDPGGRGASDSLDDSLASADAGADAAALACAPGERLGPDAHCLFIDERPATWQAARDSCRERGAGWDLASVRSQAESDFIADMLVFEAWLGATDAADEGQWLWVVNDEAFWSGTAMDGSAVGGAYVNWNGTEPNGGVMSNCARALQRTPTNPNRDAPWADLGCNTPLASICEAYAAP